jgi:putative transposase
MSAGIFHVFAHCVWAAPAHYRDDIDRLVFLRRLAEVTARTEWRCVGFCVMRTHYHLIVDVAEGVLPNAMRSLNHGYAWDFNRRHGLRGHAHSGRYGSRRVADKASLIATYGYVMNNPVEAGLCSRASLWPWSSFRGTLGIFEPNSFVDDGLILDCFRLELDARAALRRSVEKT